MKTRTLLLFVVSIVFGLAAAWMANNWLTQQSRAAAAQNQAQSTQVVVAAVDLMPGAPIEPLHIQLKDIDTRLVPPGALTSLEQAQNMVAKNNLYRGDVLRMERLAPIGEGSTLSVLLEPGMRAVTVRVNDVIGVAGFLLPGNRVDILFTEGSATRTVLKNLKVLAVDQTQHTDENRPKLVRAVTLEVNPEQAERLVNASSNGRIQLALRNPNDDRDLALEPAEDMTAAVAEPQPAPVAEPAPAPEPRVVRERQATTVDLIKGTSQQQVPVKS
ncbi:Flp pilus assembly protein CpaB [Zobellella taiwanensis]|jgi:pilus assembly protein CpaB|uniref:Flp pilus assembly protein CpaB n=1 Tax=Zobellella taiwanensis TaxID=347535 RepID=A0A2P7R9N8_9GAMM|nr:Flp pilus assembly protein CpaB [Zobellella taiwanensis]PSJ46936.1 Flp pilus assembly protein CpaB [Zobellella taiwanensis]